MSKTVLRAGVAVCALLAPIVSNAQQQPQQQALPSERNPDQTSPVPPTPAEPQESSSGDGGDIVVTGFRESYADALSTKRLSDQITDTISSDGLGRFPDLNVGEALQRLPGVQINRDAGNRNATINLRGLPGSFARTTLNGAGFADPILGNNFNGAGSTPLGAFNSEIFTSITVIKSPDASNIAGGLSGIVDLRIAPALTRKAGGFVKVSGEYNELGKLATPLIAAGYNWRVSPNFAVFGVAAYGEEKFRRDSVTVNSYANRIGAIQVGNQRAAGQNPVYDALAAQYPGGVFYPNQVRQTVKYNEGNTITGAAGFEWKASNDLKIGASGFFTRRALPKSINNVLILTSGQGNGNNASLGSTSAVVKFTELGTPFTVDTASGPRAYINSYSAENFQLNDSARFESTKQQTWAFTPTAQFDNGDWRVEAEGTVSRAISSFEQFNTDTFLVPYRNLGSAGTNGLSMNFYTGGTDLSDYRLVINTPFASHIPTGGYTIPAAPDTPTQISAPMPGQAATVTGHRFAILGTNARADNDLDAFQFKVQRSFADSFISSVQVGGRWEHNSYSSTGSSNTALGVDPRLITQDLASPNAYNSDFLGGIAPGYSSNWIQIDRERVLSLVRPVNVQPRSASNPYGLPDQFQISPESGVFLTPLGFVNNYFQADYARANFINTNTIWSAYGMVRFDGDVLGIRVRGNGGVRYERTNGQIVSLDCQNCSSVQARQTGPINHRLAERTYDNDYGYFLPSFMFTADLTSKLILRGAYYKTYVRPQPRDTIPVTTVQFPDPTSTGTPTYTVEIGAVDLSPYKSDSFDLSVEWYNRKGGLFAVAVYQKNISDYIGAIRDQAILCPSDGRFNGVDYGIGALEIADQNCRVVGDARQTRVVASGIANLQPLRVRGAEITVQQNFDFLPGFLKNFGGQVNYSHTSISGVDGSGNKLILPGVSKNNVNVIGYYETKPFGIRLVYNWRDKYDQPGGSTFLGDARTVDSRSQLDASATIRFNKRLSLSLDGFNLTNANRFEYEGDPMLPRLLNYDGRTYRATLRTTF